MESKFSENLHLRMAASFAGINDFNSSDEEPLSKMLLVDQALAEGATGFNESDDEPLIRLCEKADQADGSYIAESTESSDDNGFIEVKSRRKKRGLKNISTNHSTTAPPLNEETIHNNRLDNLLAANGFCRVHVEKDGNCFFTSASRSLSCEALELRSNLCDFLETNQTTYMPFLAQGDDEDQEDTFFRYFACVQELRTPGVWSNEVADLLPRALADWSGKEIRIYSSNPLNSVLHIYPTSNNNSNNNNNNNMEHSTPSEVISLAFLDYQPSHYDATMVTASVTPACPTPTQQSPSAIHEEVVDPDADISKSTCVENTESTIEAHSLTQRTQGIFNTPPTKTIVRKHEANPHQWKKNVRKQLRLSGKEYTTSRGKTKEAKSLRAVDCSKCTFDCKTIIETERQNIFDTFYSLTSPERQKDFVCAHVRERDTVQFLRQADERQKTRSKCRRYFLTVDDKDIKVCKKFFLATLAVGESYVDHALLNKQNGTFTGYKLVGSTPHNKTPDRATKLVKDHIASFPAVESHYTRKDTKKLYLSSSLNISKMYDLYLYTQECKASGEKPVSPKTYRAVFNRNFNISFHAPKKDQCATCVGFGMKKSQGLETEEDRQNYKEHQERKESARLEKDKDKAEASVDSSKHVVTMDLQAVLQAPCGLVGPLYYKRKLCVYNFTLYCLKSGRGTCFTWDETEGKRGACEIASCVYYYIASLDKSVTDVILYSDCCSGQNRNQYLASALLHAVSTIPNISSISHKYLETGHTQMECDSMHSAISFAKKTTPIYTPSGWDIVIRMARRHNPYIVIPLKHCDILDFKALASSIMKNTKTDTCGQRVSWLRIRVLRVEKTLEDCLLFKYAFRHDWSTLKVMGSSVRARPKLPAIGDFPRCYSSKLPISEAKKKDLLSLCTNISGIIPEEYHHFYRSLPSSKNVVERLPEPDADEEECDSS